MRAKQKDIGQMLRTLCDQKGAIIGAQACPDHIHMLLSIPPRYSVSQILGNLKGKSSLMIFDRQANLKYKYGGQAFLGKRILYGYGGAKQKADTGLYQKTVG